MKWEANDCHRNPWLCVSGTWCHKSIQFHKIAVQETPFSWKIQRILWTKGVSCGILLQEMWLFITRICEQKGISCGILLQECGILLQDYCAKNTAFLTRFTEVGERKEKSLKHRSNIKHPVQRLIHAQHQIQLINRIHTTWKSLLVHKIDDYCKDETAVFHDGEQQEDYQASCYQRYKNQDWSCLYQSKISKSLKNTKVSNDTIVSQKHKYRTYT